LASLSLTVSLQLWASHDGKEHTKVDWQQTSFPTGRQAA
jgi:hypothetical protein